jgi:chromosome segregation ATPase
MNAMKQQTIQAAQQQLAAARQVLAAAEAEGSSGKAKLDSALSKLRESSQQFKEAQSTSRHLAKQLAEIEQELLDDQGAGTPMDKATKKLDAARQKLTATEERVLAKPDNESQIAGLTGGKLLEKKTSLLKLEPDYVGAKSDFDAAAAEMSRTRTDLFKSDKDWKETNEALIEARKQEHAAEQKTHEGTGGRVSTTKKVESAAEVAAEARAMIAQAEAVLRANGVNPNPANKQQPKNKNK